MRAHIAACARNSECTGRIAVWDAAQSLAGGQTVRFFREIVRFGAHLFESIKARQALAVNALIHITQVVSN
ncbi:MULTISPECIES: hypothetical protein [unclassified Caballeronia]|uniref:hypothetical protein n=1 Tax=unclassified Caballeronia TaxID=2646786 RepID=UPI0011805200|nr:MULTISPECIES: hypothetical protein [unclassified Caballeronia]